MGSEIWRAIFLQPEWGSRHFVTPLAFFEDFIFLRCQNIAGRSVLGRKGRAASQAGHPSARQRLRFWGPGQRPGSKTPQIWEGGQKRYKNRCSRSLVGCLARDRWPENATKIGVRAPWGLLGQGQVAKKCYKNRCSRSLGAPWPGSGGQKMLQK